VSTQVSVRLDGLDGEGSAAIRAMRDAMVVARALEVQSPVRESGRSIQLTRRKGFSLDVST